MTNNKLFSRRRMINWLNRVEKPIEYTPPTPKHRLPSALDEIKQAELERDMKPPDEEEQRKVSDLIAGVIKARSV